MIKGSFHFFENSFTGLLIDIQQVLPLDPTSGMKYASGRAGIKTSIFTIESIPSFTEGIHDKRKLPFH
jgi:hypothetical protein